MSSLCLYFLKKPVPLAEQCAEHLLKNSRDLSRQLVIVPTTGAGRRIRFELAKSGGVLAPSFRLPMGALQVEEAGMARPFERLAAWAEVLADVESGQIFPDPKFLSSAAARLRSAASFVRLADELAEGGYLPGQATWGIQLPNPERWQEIAALDDRVQSKLRQAGLEDPNVCSLAEARKPTANYEKIVIASVPDLPKAVQIWAEGMAERGARVDVLVWAPENIKAEWDAWGRPVKVTGPLPAGDSLRVFPSVAEEARGALDFFADANPTDDYACVLVDSALAPEFSLALAERGLNGYDPAGKKLSQSRAGRAARLWSDWHQSKKLSDLRLICEDPVIGEWLAKQAGMGIHEMLGILDFLSVQCLASTLPQALDIHCESNRPKDDQAAKAFEKRKRFLDALKKLEKKGVVPPPLQRHQIAETEEVEELWQQVSTSPLVPENLREEIFEHAMAETLVFEAREPENSVELHGWLEAPWQPASRLALCGCAAGVLPSLPSPGPFLPDSVRSELGLSHAESRRLRDAYLLACLTLSRSPENFLVTFSRVGPDESPQLPSELLMQCEGEELPKRVLFFFGQEGSRSEAPADFGVTTKWKLAEHLRREPPNFIRATDFRSYLECPLRFYFLRVLGQEALDPRARELDSLAFGSLIHKAIENSWPAYREESEAEKILKPLLEELEKLALEEFGRHPAPAVRIQLESAKARLRAFAEIQARERREGWEIIAVERELSEQDGLKIGPLILRGKVDRIEKHPEHGIRILDYKTGRTSKDPKDAHLGPASRAFFDEARLDPNSKKAWADLQLPIYELIAEYWYPNQQIRVGYISLPADPADSGIQIFEMEQSLRDSARKCAEAIAEKVSKGIYWPPQPARHWSDPLEPLLTGGSLEQVLGEETIKFFQGHP